jgi:hypothetical protein
VGVPPCFPLPAFPSVLLLFLFFLLLPVPVGVRPALLCRRTHRHHGAQHATSLSNGVRRSLVGAPRFQEMESPLRCPERCV